MGMFSWLCAKCQKPILGGQPRGYAKFNKIVAVYSDGSCLRGSYNAYGGLEEHECEFVDDEVKLVHQHCYKREEFEELPDSPSDPDQGFTHPEAEMVELFGEPDLTGVEPATYVCTTCKRTFKSRFSRGECAFGCKPFVCPEHGPQTKRQAHDVIASTYRAQHARIDARSTEIAKARGISKDRAHNVAWDELKDEKVAPCGGCRKQVRESVMPFRADQHLVICQEPVCHYHNEFQLVWTEFEMGDANEPAEVVRCGNVADHKIEVVVLDRSAEAGPE